MVPGSNGILARCLRILTLKGCHGATVQLGYRDTQDDEWRPTDVADKGVQEMLDSTFWIFFSVFFTVWIGCVPLFYYAAKKFMNQTEEQEAG